MIQLTKPDLLDRLNKLDKDASLLHPGDGKFYITIVGGGALILLGYTSRSTLDIDIINATQVLYQLFEKYDMNGHVAAHMNNFPMNYESRTILLLEGKKIDFFSASLEDIATAKLCANRATDNEDLEVVANKINWELLEKLAVDEDELKSNIMNDKDYFFFYENYKDYVRRFKP